LLSPEWLGRAAQLAAGQQAEADYRVPKGLNLRDEIGRYWRIAQAHWSEFALGRARGDARGLSERFVTALLREAFGFASLAAVEPVELEGRAFPLGHAALDARVPVVIAPAGTGLDAVLPELGDGSRRRSAFGLAQEFLNAAEGALWGLASDGLTLRVLRDNASLTRPAWIEADLARIFVEERYADFAALWLIAHESRFGKVGTSPSECALEAWRAAGREEGTRAREHLRNGVEDALRALGSGFLMHPENGALRSALHDGSLTTQAYFQELLRLVYRLIFLLTAEERGVLHPEGAPEDGRRMYAEGYGLRRLRDRSVKRSAHDMFTDVWEGLKVVLRGLGSGQRRLALPALGGLFAAHQCPHLDAARLENRFMLTALYKLSWIREESGLARVNWRDMGPEELGSVYESLLELVPRIGEGGRTFDFATGDGTKGNARKTTGSYYTPDELVQVLLESALEPVVEATIAANPEHGADALLRLSVVDPACGSGHFLLAAGRRLAAHVARLRANGTPSAAEYRGALREVVGRCLFGVDLNPMAVELCRVSLWMEAVEPGRPLSFLDSHIQRGNALLGATPELMATGVPDVAFEPIEGDDRKTASLLKKRNKAAAEGQRGLDALWAKPTEKEAYEVTRAVAELDAAPDADPEAVAGKERRWGDLQGSAAFRHQKLVADAWCASFVWPKPAIEGKKTPPVVEAAPTNDLWRQLRDAQGEPPALTLKTVRELAEQFHFFHWHLAFPQVFSKGGFDVVLGNPPWEHVELQEQEFFSSRCPEIAQAGNTAIRKRLIAELPRTDPRLHNEFLAAARRADGENHLARDSGRFPLCGRGRVNTYALFAELNRRNLKVDGRAGFIVPTGLATDDSTKEYFATLIDRCELGAFMSFENEEFVFPAVHHSFRFALLSIDKSGRSERAELVFFARQVSALGDPGRRFSLTREEFVELNPNTRTCPTFRSRRDAELNLHMYRTAGVLWRESSDGNDQNPWGVRFAQGTFNMASDSGLFKTRTEMEAGGLVLTGNLFAGNGEWVPLLEAKMVHLFDHRYGTYEGQTESQGNQGKLPELDDSAHADPARVTLPNYWVPREESEARLAQRWDRGWLLGWRDVCRSTDQRTVVVSVLPRAGVGHKLPLILPAADPTAVACLYGNLASLALDYAARQKVGGASVAFFIFRQLPVFGPEVFAAQSGWTGPATVGSWVGARVLELTYTAWDLQSFAKDVGYDGPPFRWDPERRFLLRAELDAAFFHLYGLSRDDAAYVLETFPIVKRNDEKAHGEFRTKRVILEVFDAIAEAIRTGRAYQTRLDPPPADAAVAHEGPVPIRSRRLRRMQLPFEIVEEAGERYKTSLPLYRMRAAAGAFSDFQEGGIEAWVRPGPGIPVTKGLCIVQVRGRSMVPEIPDGAYCLFQRWAWTPKDGDVGIFAFQDETDPETGDRYTVKRARIRREHREDGIVQVGALVPANQEFAPIAVENPEDWGERIRPFAKLVKVLEVQEDESET